MPEEVSVEIEETGNGQATKWGVRVCVNGPGGLSLREKRNIVDPLNQSDYNRLESYLNVPLNLPVTLNNARIEKKIDSYSKVLLTCLRLHDYSTHFDGKKVSFWIHGNLPDSSLLSGKSIHSLHWEFLEDLSVWIDSKNGMGAKPASVTVRRCVKNSSVEAQVPKVPNSDRQGASAIPTSSILLVVARKNIHKDEIDYFNPTSVLRAILEVQAEFERRRSSKRIHLEVVRPGSYDELKRHLQRSHKKFQIVHFDMHGDIDSTEGAYLIFNRYAENGHHLEEDQIPANRIAQLLHEHGIRCAVLSSCKTAIADAGIKTNLSWSLLQRGKMTSVLAISSNIPDTMSKIFFPRFYLEIFVNDREFADAAAIARRELRRDPRRWSYEQKKHIPLKDWFIPKVYSNGKLEYFGRTPNQRSAFHRINTYRQLIITLAVGCLIQRLGWGTLWFRMLNVKLDHGASAIRETCSFFALWLVLFTLTRLTNWAICHWAKRKFVQRLVMIDRDRKNILRIEGDLRRTHRILLRTVNDDKNTAHTFVDTLSHVWCRTHLIQHRVMIQAEWFLQPILWDDPVSGFKWSHLPRWVGHYLHPLRHRFPPDLAQLRRRAGADANIVVVVANLGLLFPGETQEQAYHQNGQSRFRDWLERHFAFQGTGGDESAGKTGPPPCYLILIGKWWKEWGDGTRPLLHDSLRGVKALERIIVTDYTNPENFEHQL